MPWRNALETRRDRVAMAEDAGFGRVSLVSVLAGTLVAYGAFAVLLALTAAVAKAVGVDTDLTGTGWRRLGTAGGVIVAVVLLVCYLFGGYVAGRMARRAGVTNGFLVFVVSLVVAVTVTGLVNLFTDGGEILANLRNVGVPTSSSEWGDVATVAGIGSLLAMLVGAVVGGALGERWHAKLVDRALDPSIGPEAEARAAAEERHLQAEERMARTRMAGRSRPDGDDVAVVDRGPGEEASAVDDDADRAPPAGEAGDQGVVERKINARPERDVSRRDR